MAPMVSTPEGLWKARRASGSTLPAGGRPVALDGVDDLAVPALLALHVHGNHGMDRRKEPQHVEYEPENQAWHDQNEVEQRREGLPVEQETERRQERSDEVEH